MTEIIHALFNPLPNAIMSGIMIVLFIYWIAAFLGVGFDDMDFGLGFEADVDVDAGIDVDTNAEVGDGTDTDTNAHAHTDSVFVSVLKFMNVGKVPFMMVFSTLKFFIWTGSLISTQLVPIEGWGWKSVFILLPLFIIGIFLTRYATRPIARFLEKTGYHGEDEIDFMGRSGSMLSTIQGDKMGIAEFLIDKNPIKLMVISENGSKIGYGEKVVVTNETTDKKTYFVTQDYTIE